MFGRRIRLLRLAGIPIYLDLSWFLVLLLLTDSLATYFQQEAPEQPVALHWLAGIITSLLFFVCILLHELGHALVARGTGLAVRGITLFLFGGVAEMAEEPSSAGKEFVMAIAGPVVSLFLAGLFLALANVGQEWLGWPSQSLRVLLLVYLGTINLLVLGFNLIPGFPLDGGRVLRSLLWAVTGNLRRATWWAALAGQTFAWLLIVVGVVLFFYQQWLNGIWLGILGLFLNQAARSSYQQVLIREALRGEPVVRFMNHNPIVVPPYLTLRDWVEEYVYRYHRKSFPVAEDGRLEGLITTRVLQGLPREEWERHLVSEVMLQDLRAVSIPPTADALDALAQMQRTGHSRLLVTEGDRLLGIVSLKDLLRFLQMKLALAEEED
jgi:Zn-dependent protease/CBS domain-containing protein